MSEKLKVRAQLKSRKPKFGRVQSHQFAKLKNSNKWRKPKGMGNKVRRNRRGKPSQPTAGYGSPKEVRGLNKQGLAEIIVTSVVELKSIGKGQIAVIGSNVGGRRKLEILKEAKKSNVAVGNVKDVNVSIKSLTKEPKKKEAKKTETPKKEEAKADDKKEEKKAEPKKAAEKKEAKK